MYVQIAISAIGIGIVLMVGYLIVAQVKNNIPTPQVDNDCYGVPTDNETGYPDCYGADDNTSEIIDSESFTTGLADTQGVVFAGLSLVAVSIIVIAGFSLIKIFQ